MPAQLHAVAGEIANRYGLSPVESRHAVERYLRHLVRVHESGLIAVDESGAANDVVLTDEGATAVLELARVYHEVVL